MMMPNELNRASTKIALMPTKIKFWGAIAINNIIATKGLNKIQ